MSLQQLVYLLLIASHIKACPTLNDYPRLFGSRVLRKLPGENVISSKLIENSDLPLTHYETNGASVAQHILPSINLGEILSHMNYSRCPAKTDGINTWVSFKQKNDSRRLMEMQIIHGINPSQFLSFVRGLLQDLSILHSYNVSHNRISPYQLLWDSHMKRGSLNFSLSPTVFDSNGKVLYNKRALNNPFFKPDQFDAQGRFNARDNDLYTLGLSIYHLCLEVDPNHDASTFPVKLHKLSINACLNIFTSQEEYKDVMMAIYKVLLHLLEPVPMLRKSAQEILNVIDSIIPSLKKTSPTNYQVKYNARAILEAKKNPSREYEQEYDLTEPFNFNSAILEDMKHDAVSDLLSNPFASNTKFRLNGFNLDDSDYSKIGMLPLEQSLMENDDSSPSARSPVPRKRLPSWNTLLGESFKEFGSEKSEHNSKQSPLEKIRSKLQNRPQKEEPALIKKNIVLHQMYSNILLFVYRSTEPQKSLLANFFELLVRDDLRHEDEEDVILSDAVCVNSIVKGLYLTTLPTHHCSWDQFLLIHSKYLYEILSLPYNNQLEAIEQDLTLFSQLPWLLNLISQSAYADVPTIQPFEALSTPTNSPLLSTANSSPVSLQISPINIILRQFTIDKDVITELFPMIFTKLPSLPEKMNRSLLCKPLINVIQSKPSNYWLKMESFAASLVKMYEALDSVINMEKLLDESLMVNEKQREEFLTYVNHIEGELGRRCTKGYDRQFILFYHDIHRELSHFLEYTLYVKEALLKQ